MKKFALAIPRAARSSAERLGPSASCFRMSYATLSLPFSRSRLTFHCFSSSTRPLYPNELTTLTQRPHLFILKTLCLHLKDPMSLHQRPYVSTSETYYKENSINPPQPAKRSIKVNFFSTFFFLIFISLSLLLKKSTYHAPYHQAHFLFFFPTAFLTRFVLPTSFFTSSLASSIAIRSRRSSAISSCSVGRWSLYLAAKMRLLL